MTETMYSKGVVHHDTLAATLPVLKPGELFQLDLNAAPKFGCARQGGCHSINLIADTTMGRCLEFVTADTDHNLPGTNAPGPYGGCYAVHRVGGVAACLIVPGALLHDHMWFIRYKVGIPSHQPGLARGFPQSMQGKWLSLHESYGAPMRGAPVTELALGTDAMGKINFVYGPASQNHSFWIPMQFDKWFDFIIAMTPSWNPKVGGASVMCNGVPVKSKAGNIWEPYQTQVASDGGGGPASPSNFIAYIQQYRSANFGGSVRTLHADFRIGTSLAAVS